MYIVYAGNFRPVHSTENHIAKTLEKLGHTVERRQEDQIQPRDLWPANADMFLFTRTWPGFVTNKLLDFYKSRGIPTVSYHLDLYMGLKRDGGLGIDPFWNTDFVFSPDGGHDSEFKKLNINHHYLRAGVFEDECYIHPDYDPDRFDNDIIFVGSYNYHPEHPYRQKLIDWLTHTYKHRFKLVSPQFNNGEQVRGDDLNRLYAKTRVVIGDSLNVGFKQKEYWSDRVYETLGRGGFLIHPHVKGLESEFKLGHELQTYPFDDFSVLAFCINTYLENNDHRETVRMNGHEKVKNNYTYTQRVQQMLNTVFK